MNTTNLVAIVTMALLLKGCSTSSMPLTRPSMADQAGREATCKITTPHQHSSFDDPIDCCDDPSSPPALSLVALQLTKSIDALLRSLRLYDACLRDHLLAEHSDPDLPF